MDKIKALADAVGQHQDTINSTKRRYTQCKAQLNETPVDASLLAAGQRVECAVTRICATSMTAPGIFACYAERSN